MKEKISLAISLIITIFLLIGSGLIPPPTIISGLSQGLSFFTSTLTGAAMGMATSTYQNVSGHWISFAIFMITLVILISLTLATRRTKQPVREPIELPLLLPEEEVKIKKWRGKRTLALDEELDGINQRIENHRQKELSLTELIKPIKQTTKKEQKPKEKTVKPQVLKKPQEQELLEQELLEKELAAIEQELAHVERVFPKNIKIRTTIPSERELIAKKSSLRKEKFPKMNLKESKNPWTWIKSIKLSKKERKKAKKEAIKEVKEISKKMK